MNLSRSATLKPAIGDVTVKHRHIEIDGIASSIERLAPPMRLWCCSPTGILPRPSNIAILSRRSPTNGASSRLTSLVSATVPPRIQTGSPMTSTGTPASWSDLPQS